MLIMLEEVTILLVLYVKSNCEQIRVEVGVGFGYDPSIK